MKILNLVVFLVPQIVSIDEPLDLQGNPCSFTRLKPNGFKGKYTILTWLGIAIGYCSNIKPLDSSDYANYKVELKCPECEKYLYGNKVGSLLCECGYTEELFFKEVNDISK